MTKRAALALSINAIVILIIAITMLGLALGFTRGMFGKVTTQMEEKISEEPEPAAASATDPTTLSREVIVTQAEENEILKVSVYNPSGNVWTDEKPAIIECSDGIGDLTVNVNTRTIKPTESVTYTILFDAPVVAGSHLCKVIVPSLSGTPEFGKYYKELTIKIVQ